MLAIRGVYEVAIRVRDLARSEPFYRDVLGFEPGLRDDRRHWLFLWVAGTAGMVVLQQDPTNWAPQHLAFSVDEPELERAAAILKERGSPSKDLFFTSGCGPNPSISRTPTVTASSSAPEPAQRAPLIVAPRAQLRQPRRRSRPAHLESRRPGHATSDHRRRGAARSHRAQRDAPAGRQAAARPPAEAHGRGCDLVVFPELALTTFFPRWWMEDQAEIDAFFEREMPGPETRPLFDEARRLGIGFCLGYAELAVEGGRDAPLQHLDPGRPGGPHRRQVPEDPPARPCRARAVARLPAPREALLRGGRSRLPGVARLRRDRRHVHLQRPALAGDLSRDGAPGRGDDPARLQHARPQPARARARPARQLPQSPRRCRRAPTRTGRGWWAWPSAGARRGAT